jgi:very-short-patch-repair endonuclease
MAVLNYILTATFLVRVEVVEVDGEIHDFQVTGDKHRDQVLMEKGLEVIRIRNEEIRNNVQDAVDIVTVTLSIQRLDSIYY